MKTQQTTQDLFRRSKQEWLEEARETARQLLKKRYSITIEDVLRETPRPQYISPKAIGGVFQHPDFVAVAFVFSKRAISHSRVIRAWKLKEDHVFAVDDEPVERIWEETY